MTQYSGLLTRKQWLQQMDKIAFLVINNAAKGCLKQKLPLSKAEQKRGVACLEAVGRSLAGIAPWLELDEKEITDPCERDLQAKYRRLARQALANIVDPQNPDYCVWNKSETNLMPDQPVVDAAYVASAIIKAPKQLWGTLSESEQKNVLLAFDKVLLMKPLRSNWLLFTAEIEACKYMLTGIGDGMRIEYALSKFYEWYQGDGVYGDGEHFQWDYYNSFVIQPMLEEISRVAGALLEPHREKFTAQFINSIKRYSEVQERMVAPDGSYPPIGRSVTYRMAAFQALAHTAYRQMLPSTLSGAQVRCALSKVINKAMSAPDLFDSDGFLTKGLYGKQESLANSYTNTGSLYICLCVFLPLGLPPKDKFWSSNDEKTTWEKAWDGTDIGLDASAEYRGKIK